MIINSNNRNSVPQGSSSAPAADKQAGQLAKATESGVPASPVVRGGQLTRTPSDDGLHERITASRAAAQPPARGGPQSAAAVRNPVLSSMQQPTITRPLVWTPSDGALYKAQDADPSPLVQSSPDVTEMPDGSRVGQFVRTASEKDLYKPT